MSHNGDIGNDNNHYTDSLGLMRLQGCNDMLHASAVGTRYMPHATCYVLLATCYMLLVTGHWLHATCYWLLATGYWLLATGNWQLATGYC